MKTKIQALPILAAVLLAAGVFTACVTTRTERIAHLATVSKIVAKDATSLYLAAHPENRPAFVAAREELMVLEAATNLNFGLVLAIVHHLPIRQLANPVTQLLITDTEIILTDLNASIPLDQVNDLRPIVKALADGIGLGLDMRGLAPGLTVAFASAPSPGLQALLAGHTRVRAAGTGPAGTVLAITFDPAKPDDVALLRRIQAEGGKLVGK